MVSMLADGVMYFIDVIQVYLALFYVQKCQVVLDYGGYNMVHRKVLHKKQLHVHGHVKQVDDVQVQVVLLLILVQQLVKVNKKLKLFFHNPFVQLHHHPRVISIQEQVQVDQIAVVSYHSYLQLVDHQLQVIVHHGIKVPMALVEHQTEIQVQPFKLLEHQVDRHQILMVNSIFLFIC